VKKKHYGNSVICEKSYSVFSLIVTVIFNQLNIKNKIKKDNFGENHQKKTLRRNTVAINNVLNKKITKLNSQSTQYKKKSTNIILKK
jgi:hypothetical protein